MLSEKQEGMVTMHNSVQDTSERTSCSTQVVLVMSTADLTKTAITMERLSTVRSDSLPAAVLTVCVKHTKTSA